MKPRTIVIVCPGTLPPTSDLLQQAISTEWRMVHAFPNALIGLLKLQDPHAVVVDSAAVEQLSASQLHVLKESTAELLHVGEADASHQLDSSAFTTVEPTELPRQILKSEKSKNAKSANRNGSQKVLPTNASSAEEWGFELVLGSEHGQIPAAVQILLDQCAARSPLSSDVRFRLGVALEEALVNAIVHGNLEVHSELKEISDDAFDRKVAERQRTPPYSQRLVSIRCRFSSQMAEFQVQDEGQGFDLKTIPDPTDPANLEKPCGRGLLLMRSFAHEVSFNSNGTQVTIVHRTSPDERPSANAECLTENPMAD